MDYYLINRRLKTKFDLGRHKFKLLETKKWLYDKSLLLEAIVQGYALQEQFSAGYCLYLRDKIWEWVQDGRRLRTPDPKDEMDFGPGYEKNFLFCSDRQLLDLELSEGAGSNNGPIEYKLTGSRYCNDLEWRTYVFEKYPE